MGENTVKYPRTPHLPWSDGVNGDDIVSGVPFHHYDRVVVTEKLDGENTTIGRDFIHARSADPRKTKSLGIAKSEASRFQYKIPEELRLVVENIAVVHSIRYNNIPGPLILISAYADVSGTITFWSWAALTAMSTWFELPLPPVLYHGAYNESLVKNCYTGKSMFGGEQEGYVVRSTAPFARRDFGINVCKYVRKDHVSPNSQHWMFGDIKANWSGA